MYFVCLFLWTQNLINDDGDDGDLVLKTTQPKKVFSGRIFELSPIQTYAIVKKINIFRNNLANGKVFNYENTASRMRMIDWSPEFYKLAKLSIQQSPNGDDLGCTATGMFKHIKFTLHFISI